MIADSCQLGGPIPPFTTQNCNYKNLTKMEFIIIALVALAVLVSRVGKVNEKKLFDKSQSEYFDYKLNKMIERESVRILL